MAEIDRSGGVRIRIGIENEEVAVLNHLIRGRIVQLVHVKTGVKFKRLRNLGIDHVKRVPSTRFRVSVPGKTRSEVEVVAPVGMLNRPCVKIANFQCVRPRTTHGNTGLVARCCPFVGLS